MSQLTLHRPAVKRRLRPRLAAEPLSIPVRRLRAAVKAAPEVNVSVPFDREHSVLMRISKAEVLRAIPRMRQRSPRVRAYEAFGALVIG